MRKKIAIITGIDGQDGAFLSDLLLKKNYRVIGIALSMRKERMAKLEYFGIADKVDIITGSISDVGLMKKILKERKPDEIYNLAGQSSVAGSWEDPTGTFETNASAVIQMLDLIRVVSPQSHFLQCSSAEIYGEAHRVITDNHIKYDPLNPYGISKLAAHLGVKNFRDQYGLFACNAILFNHESPLRADCTATKKIAGGVVKIALGLESKIKLGNLDVNRDWGYAGDFVKAMWLMSQGEKPEDYIICTGVSFPLKKFVKEAFRCVGIKNWRDYIVVDDDLMRKQEVKSMRGSPARINKELGWKSEIDFKNLVKIMVDFEMGKLK